MSQRGTCQYESHRHGVTSNFDLLSVSGTIVDMIHIDVNVTQSMRIKLRFDVNIRCENTPLSLLRNVFVKRSCLAYRELLSEALVNKVNKISKKVTMYPAKRKLE